MNVSIIGTGYVGLVTGACLAEKGHSVTCVDIDPERVATLNRAQSPIFESGLDELLRKHVGRTLRATTDLPAAVSDSELTLIAVGTPFNGQTIDLAAVMAASRGIGSTLRNKTSYHVVVVKSTVVPGTTDLHVIPALEAATGKRAGVDFGVGMNPEFLSQGEAVHDFMFPDRIVLGGNDATDPRHPRRTISAFCRGSPHPYQHAHCRTHQVRLERPPRESHIILERDREPLFCFGGHRCDGCYEGSSPQSVLWRPQHRGLAPNRVFLAGWLRIWRKLSPKRCQGAHCSRTESGSPDEPPGVRDRGQ